ncbi:Fic family protein [Actinomyces sp. MRS3W]|uniref:Fic family protein n=1 Tax=Actinomyces sp. MRS3W TaxID=2800796 RepID=UPI0028FD2C95|nr:Fic family protein [Actinomyces sp. MRS3W]MDU0349322.1 Fic family protein [Actinomyces sp. MRS3W]
MDLAMFSNDAMGELVKITGSDPLLGDWEHMAFVPAPLRDEEPELSGATYRAVAAAGRSLAALDATARQLPNPRLLRTPSLRREAQSTSALEGTYAPLDEILTADDDSPATVQLREILNYAAMADFGFAWVQEGRPLTLNLIEDLQGLLMHGTPLAPESGHLRSTQVVVGRRDGVAPGTAPIRASRFVPSPPGDQLRSGMSALVDWLRRNHAGAIDPVVVAGMAHYQFETLHPFRDGNGRLGRYLIVLTLMTTGVLSEPTLTVSPWFEARRTEYYDALLAVSTDGDWDSFLTFFSRGLEEAAHSTREQMLALVAVQEELKEVVRSSTLRSGHALSLVDFAIANPSFTVKKVATALGVSYGRANGLVKQLVELGVLAPVTADHQPRRFMAPRALRVLLEG